MIQYVQNGILYATEDHWVFRSDDLGKRWRKICRLPCGGNAIRAVKDQFLRWAPVRRLRRNIGIHNLVVLPNGTLVLHYNGIFRCKAGKDKAERVFDFRQSDIIGPLKNGLAVDPRDGSVYFGEYSIQRPRAVRIFRGIRDGRYWEECYRFEEGRIRHVHAIVHDPYRDRLWICTGDNDDEAGLFYTDDRFKSVHLFGGGDQSWRMVSLIPTKDALLWGSDAGQDAPADRENGIYRWDFAREKKEMLQPVDKPAYYSTCLADGTLVIGTHFEPLMKRNADKSADIWISEDQGNSWKRILRFPFKPSGRKQGTKYASVCFPKGDDSSPLLFFTLLNVNKYDFSLMHYGTV